MMDLFEAHLIGGDGFRDSSAVDILPTKIPVCALITHGGRKVVISDGCTAFHRQICSLKMFYVMVALMIEIQAPCCLLVFYLVR